jgi:dipeptidyl aminopeptidase/acylaminoacyl peptidase
MRKIFLYISVFCFIFYSTDLIPQQIYKLPPQEVIDIVDAIPIPYAIVSPQGKYLLLAEYQAMPSIEYMAKPMLRLAGKRILPGNNSSQQTRFYTAFTIINLSNGMKKRLKLPDDSKLGFPVWSFDDSWIAFLKYQETTVELWGVEIKNGNVKKFTNANINSALSSGFTWLPDNYHILVSTVLPGRGIAPQKPTVPLGPIIHESSGKVSKIRTFQDLLQNPYDEKLFEYYCTSQLIEIDVKDHTSRKIGEPGIYLKPDVSPNGNLILVHKIKKPYSYSVPYYRFAHNIEIWNRNGNLIHLLAELPIADEVPVRGVATGIRSVNWFSHKPAKLIWVEALDGGDPEKQVPHRDKLMTLNFPFKEKPIELLRIKHRYSGIDWLMNEGSILVTEYDWTRRWHTTYLTDINNTMNGLRKIFDISVHDRYNDPGDPVYTVSKNGEYYILQEGDWIYFSGSGASPDGDHPFLKKMNLNSLEKEIIFQNTGNCYESFFGFVDKNTSRILTRYESKFEPPNYYLVDLKSGEKQVLTEFEDSFPQLTDVKKTLLKYKRNDGVDLSGTLYLPSDYIKGEKLPLVLWAYPREYSDLKVAGQVKGSPHKFTFLKGTSRLFFITQGYAILDNAQMPVIGDPKTMNDTFVDQIVASAKAAIDTLDAMGIIDPNRVGVGGHSYGAFMTANLLAHCDLFKAGIARSGAYNRTLTPFGFQSERRTLWEAPDVYFNISPFMHANKINEPILLIHGVEDNNAGTFPIQSQRLYHAIKGYGGTARLIMLPNESHAYRARESVLHVLAEMFEWFDRYVKNNN